MSLIAFKTIQQEKDYYKHVSYNHMICNTYNDMNTLMITDVIIITIEVSVQTSVFIRRDYLLKHCFRSSLLV